MPTKPSVTPRVWCSAGVYTTGPFIGSISRVDPGAGIAAEGFRPGSAFPTAAEHANFEEYYSTLWIVDWLSTSSATGAADAHLVETASTGRTALVGLNLNDAVNETVLNVVGVNTVAPAVLVTALSGGTAYQATIDPDATGFTTTIGAGDGRGFSVDMVNSGPAAAGLLVTDDAASEGDGVRVSMTGTGYGVFASSSGTGPAGRFVSTGVQVALAVIGSASSVTGASFTGGTSRVVNIDADGAALAAQMVGGDTAGTNALLVTCGNNTGKAIVAALPNAATSASRGFYCSTGNGAGIAAEFVSSGTGASGNYALSLSGDTTSPTKGILFMQPQNADPSAGGESGGLAFSTAKGLTGGNFADGTWRSYWNSVNGYACAFVNNYGYGSLGLTLPNSVFSIVGTITTANTGDEIKVANATILVRLSFSMKSNSTTDTVLSIRVRDVTDGNTIVWERIGTGSSDNAGYFIPGNDAATNRYWVPGPAVEIELTPSAAGTRQYTVSMCAPTNVALRIRDLTAAFVGTVA